MNVIEAAEKRIQNYRIASSAARSVFEVARDVLVEEGGKQGHRKFMVENMGTFETPVSIRIQSSC